MIQMQTLVDVADNSGAKTARCIKVLGGTGRRTASIGDVVIVAIQKSMANSQFKKKAIARAVVVRTRYVTRRSDGSHIRFDGNAVCLVDAENAPRGTRVFGAVPRELREKRFSKIISLAVEVV